MSIYALLSLSDFSTNMKIGPPNIKFWTNNVNFCWDWVFRVRSHVTSLLTISIWDSTTVTLVLTLRKGLKNGNLKWHLPWRGMGSRVPLRYFEKKIVAKMRFAHGLSFILCIYIVEVTMNMAIIRQSEGFELNLPYLTWCTFSGKGRGPKKNRFF